MDKWDIFHYVFGLLHHPGYRTKYADNLKRELPRIPFAPSPRPSPARGEGEKGGFWAFAKAGEKLAKLHLDYEKLKPWDLDFIETPGLPLSYRVEDKMRLSKDKLRLAVNPSLTLSGIPPEVFEYRLGNRSVLEWVIDQYQVSEDKRSGIKSDPNRNDEERIHRAPGRASRSREHGNRQDRPGPPRRIRTNVARCQPARRRATGIVPLVSCGPETITGRSGMLPPRPVSCG